MSADGSVSIPRAKPSRLESSARTLLAKAEAALAQDRTTNTRRRAEQAAGAVANAQRQALRAKVALAVVEAGGKLGPAAIASLKDIELLEVELSRATGWLDDSRRMSESDAVAAEKAKMPIKPDGGSPPHTFEYYKERVTALSRMGVLVERQFRETLSALVALRSSVDRPTEDPVRALERRLVGFSAPGFFPTPRNVAARMAELAGIVDGTTVLEPSAGSGRLADAARDRGGAITCVEANHTLCELLTAKGHAVVRGDFLDFAPMERFDCVCMNPPFEDSADALHVRHAFSLLKPGGALVAITGEGAWFREDRVSREFRAWIGAINIFHNEKLPPGTFNHSDVTQRTGVAARLFAIRKAGA